MKRNAARDILCGQFLASKFIARNWKLILYSFVLVLVYISIHFGIRDTMRMSAANKDIIRNLRSEYMEKYNSILYRSKRSEIELLLNNENSKLIPPSMPPERIKLNDDY